MVVDRGNHHIWGSQDLNKERSRSCRLHADQDPGGVVTKLDECFQDVYRQLAAAMEDLILVASRFRLQRFLDMLWGTEGRKYWRKFVAF
jgi:hypothetical protein